MAQIIQQYLYPERTGLSDASVSGSENENFIAGLLGGENEAQVGQFGVPQKRISPRYISDKS
jgi:hypothetical protein